MTEILLWLLLFCHQSLLLPSLKLSDLTDSNNATLCKPFSIIVCRSELTSSLPSYVGRVYGRLQ